MAASIGRACAAGNVHIEFSWRALDLAELGDRAKLSAKVNSKVEEHAGGEPERRAASGAGADSGAHGGDGDGLRTRLRRRRSDATCGSYRAAM